MDNQFASDDIGQRESNVVNHVASGDTIEAVRDVNGGIIVDWHFPTAQA